MKYVSAEKFMTKDLIFGEPEEGALPDGQKFGKIPISVQHLDNTVRPLVIVTDPCFSFGVQKDSKYNTYTLPLVLYDRDGPTPGQKAFVSIIKQIRIACNPEPKPCLYGSMDRPTMYPKIMYSKRDKQFITKFYERKDIESNSDSKRIEPTKFPNKHCVAKVAIRVESVFVAKTTTLQVRVHKATLSKVKRGQRDFEDSDDDL